MVDLMMKEDGGDFVGVRKVTEIREASFFRLAEEKRRFLQLDPGADRLVVCCRIGSRIEQLTAPEPVPAGDHAFACRSLVESLADHVELYGSRNIILLTSEDHFEFCVKGKCAHQFSCKRFPEGMRVVSLRPFSETWVVRPKAEESLKGVSAL